jgi:sec-independent protein translocase protein TatA
MGWRVRLAGPQFQNHGPCWLKSLAHPAPRRIFMFLRDLLIPSHLLVLVGLFLLFFGGKKLPEFGKGLGDGIRSFKSSVKEIGQNVQE